MTRLSARSWLLGLLLLLPPLSLGGCKGTQSAALESIHFYQQHVGQQWGFHCDFEPSCSEFGKQAISRHGVFAGTMLTTDRLMRDHSLSRHLYHQAADGHPLDPVADHAWFAAPPSDAADAPLAEEEGEISARRSQGPEESWSFAEELFHEKEYERAWIEYRRFMRQHPGSARAEEARQRTVLCLTELGRTQRARDEVYRLPPSPGKDLLLAHSLRREGRLEEAIVAADSKTRASRLYAGLLALEGGFVDQAREQFEGLPDGLRNRLRERTDAYEHLPHRSPALAGTLSALLPGSGHMYAGRYGDGVVALLTNGMLIGGSVWAASRDENVTAAALGFFALGFYTGNIFGATSAAHRHNDQAKDQFLTRTRGFLRQERTTLGITGLRDGGVLQLYLEF